MTPEEATALYAIMGLLVTVLVNFIVIELQQMYSETARNARNLPGTTHRTGTR